MFPSLFGLVLGEADRRGTEIGGDCRKAPLRNEPHDEDVAVPRLDPQLRAGRLQLDGEGGAVFGDHRLRRGWDC